MDGPVPFVKRVANQVQEDDVMGISAELAYRFLFALFPFAIFLAALGAFVAQWAGIENPAEELIAMLGQNLPPEMAEEIQPQLEQVVNETRPGLLSFGALFALWAANGGTMALMKAMNRAFDIEESRGFVARYAMGIGLTLLASVGVIGSFIIIIGGTVLTEEIAQQLGIGGAAWTAITLLRWPLVLVFLAVAVAILFRLAPNFQPAWKRVLVGGFVFAIGWLIATAGFGLYVANFGNYDNTYGALGGVIILMLWFYLTALVLLVAAEIVAVLVKENEPEQLEERKRETSDSRLREKAGRVKQRIADGLPGRGGDSGEDGDGRARPPGREAGSESGRPWTVGRPGRTAAPGPQRAGQASSNPVIAALIVGAGMAVGAFIGAITGRSAAGE
jgi:membrane protein